MIAPHHSITSPHPSRSDSSWECCWTCRGWELCSQACGDRRSMGVWHGASYTAPDTGARADISPWQPLGTGSRCIYVSLACTGGGGGVPLHSILCIYKYITASLSLPFFSQVPIFKVALNPTGRIFLWGMKTNTSNWRSPCVSEGHTVSVCFMVYGVTSPVSFPGDWLVREGLGCVRKGTHQPEPVSTHYCSVYSITQGYPTETIRGIFYYLFIIMSDCHCLWICNGSLCHCFLLQFLLTSKSIRQWLELWIKQTQFYYSSLSKFVIFLPTVLIVSQQQCL